MFVTPTAVSHHIKSLEGHLGIKLFERLPRGLELTEAGRELLPEITSGFVHFARGVSSLNEGAIRGGLSVSAAPSFATLWLVPRLNSFIEAFPEIKVRIVAADDPPDLHKGEADIRIPFGLGNYPGLHTRSLLRDTIFPVCAPSLLNQTPLRRFSDLQNHTLLHDIDVGDNEPTMTWTRWLQDADVSSSFSDRAVEFGDSILLTEAAVRGQGVALGRMSLVRDHLANGRLIRPFKASRPSEYQYFTVTTEAGAERSRVQVFIRWLEEQVENEFFEQRLD